MANPFVIERSQAPMQGLAMLAPAMQRRGERALERSKQKQYMKLREDTARIMSTGTANDIADFVTKNPGAAAVADEAINFKSENTKRSLIEGAKSRLMGKVDPTESLMEHAQLVVEEGGDAKQSIQAVEAAIKSPFTRKMEAKERIDKYTGSYPNEETDLKTLALYDTKTYNAIMKYRHGTTEKDTRTAAIKDWEYGETHPEFRAQQKKQAEDDRLTQHELKLASMLASGEIDASQIPKRGKTYNRIVSGAKEINPELNIRSATADYNLSKNPTFRQRTLTAEVLPDIIQHVVDAGKKVDFSNIKAVGGFQKFYKQNINDPDMVEYMALRNDALMELASVMRGGGMTDKAHHAEEEAMSPTMSPRALDAWMRAQTKALKPRLAIQRRIIEGGTKKTGRKKRRKYNPQTGGFE